MDVAGRARTAAAAQRQELVKTIVADRFHHGQTIIDADFGGFACAVGDDQSGHGLGFLFGCCAQEPAL
jgi:hypothetical protein